MKLALQTLVAVWTSAAIATDPFDALVSKDAADEARKAFASGNKRHIVIPVCTTEGGEVLPGWPLEESAKAQRAMKDGLRPLSCTDLSQGPSNARFIRAAKYAEQYNGQLLKLEAAVGK